MHSRQFGPHCTDTAEMCCDITTNNNIVKHGRVVVVSRLCSLNMCSNHHNLGTVLTLQSMAMCSCRQRQCTLTSATAAGPGCRKHLWKRLKCGTGPDQRHHNSTRQHNRQQRHSSRRHSWPCRRQQQHKQQFGTNAGSDVHQPYKRDQPGRKRHSQHHPHCRSRARSCS